MLACVAMAVTIGALRSGSSAPVASPTAVSAASAADSVIPVAARPVLSAWLGRDMSTYHLRGMVAHNPAQSLVARFSAAGTTISSGRLRFGVRLCGVELGSAACAAQRAVPRATSNRVSFSHADGVRELWVNGPLGLEQTFTVPRRPHRHGDLTLTIAISGRVTQRIRGSQVLLRGAGQTLTLAGLRATDANGRLLSAYFMPAGRAGRVGIVVDTRGARFPVRIDPTFTKVNTLTAATSAAQNQLGYSVAVQGTTIVAGAPKANAVYVFTEPPSGWANATQAGILTASDAQTGGDLGWSVAIYGTTIVAGAPGAYSGTITESNPRQGAVYVFTQPSSGWANVTQAAKLTATYEQPNAPNSVAPYALGTSVAISGSTIVAGGIDGYEVSGQTSIPLSPPLEVYSEPSGGWASSTGSPTASLTTPVASGDGEQTWPVAISGQTIVGGNYGGNGASGMVDVYTAPSGVWTSAASPTAVLDATDGAEGDALGESVGIDGDTIVAGAPAHSVGGVSAAGAVYVFVEPQSGWTSGPQTAELTDSVPKSEMELGTTVAISGQTIVAGAQFSNTDVFSEPSGGWADGTDSGRLTAIDTGQQGESVAVCGSTAVVGEPEYSPSDETDAGAAYVFGSSGGSEGCGLSVTRVSPGAGALSGGNTVTITGEDLGGVTSVAFEPEDGGATLQGTDVTDVSDTEVTAVAPDATGDIQSGQTAVETDVVVQSPAGTSTINNGDRYMFGCEDDTSLADGNWEADGCFYQPDANDDDTTQSSSLDGLVVTPAGSATDDYSPSASDLSSSGSSSVALNLTALTGSTLHVPVATGALDLNLGTATLLQALQSGFQLAGIPLSGNLTFKPEAGGTLSATGSGTLPAILGGGTATVSLTSTLNGGVSKLTVTADKGSLAGLFELESITLNYAGGTWSVMGTATTPTGGHQTVTGSLTYNAAGQLTLGQLQLSNISLGGLVTIKSLAIAYSPSAGSWGGAAEIAQGKQSATLSLNFDSTGTLTSGSFKASGVTLFQVFDLKTFELTYEASSKTWKLSIEIANEKSGASASADFTEVDGAIQGVDIDIKKIPMFAKMTLKELKLTYATKDGKPTYSGKADVELPGTLVSEVIGELTFTNGDFTKGSLTLKGNVPLFEVVFLTRLGAEVTLTPRKEIAGDVDLSFGPKVAGHQLLGLDDGRLDYKFPSGSAPGTYTASGTLKADKVVLGQAKLVVDDKSTIADVTLGDNDAGFSAGKVANLHGEISGHVVRSSFTLRGDIHLTLHVLGHDYGASAQVTASNRGIVACGSFPAVASGSSGVAIEWGQAPVLKKGDCAPANF